MKVIFDVSKIKQKFIRPILAVGVFDGLHVGHRYLIQKVVNRARKVHGTSIVFTFFPHPMHVLNPTVQVPLLATLEERIRLIEGMGVNVCIIIHFTRKFSKITPVRFIKECLLKKISKGEIFVGYDFRFGKDRQGDFNLLQLFGKKYGFKAHTIPAVKKAGLVVSSTRIRELIASGDLKNSNRLLGRNVCVSGVVRKGDGRGKLLGFPTANLGVGSQVVVPRGVYIVKVIINKKKYRGIANVGVRPSFKKVKKVSVEAHILNFHKSIYGKPIILQFLKRIREEKKFKTKADLITQLQNDKKQALKHFRS